MAARLGIELTVGTKKARRRSHRFRLLLIGDFSGRAARRAAGEVRPLARPIEVDGAEIDRAVRKVAPELPIAGTGERFTVLELEHFHPDSIFDRLEVLAAARSLRPRLAGAGDFESAVAEAARWMGGSAAAPRPEPTADADLLARLLGERPRTEAPKAGFERALDEIVRPHVVADVGARRTAALGALDEALTAKMREILGTPALRALESTWRAAHFVASRLDDAQVYLLDAAQEDLATASRVDLEALLGEEGYSTVAADLTFGRSLDDLRLLALLGSVTSGLGAPLLAGADPALAEPDFAQPPAVREAWNELRASELASWIGLALPRVLLRLPYGRRTDAIERFAFEELPPGAGGSPAHRVYGSAAYAASLLIGLGFADETWNSAAGEQLELGGLPAHTFDDGGEQRLVPCAEVALSERAALSLLERGFMPVLAHRDKNAVRFVRLQSIAAPPGPLSGPWK